MKSVDAGCPWWCGIHCNCVINAAISVSETRAPKALPRNTTPHLRKSTKVLALVQRKVTCVTYNQ